MKTTKKEMTFYIFILMMILLSILSKPVLAQGQAVKLDSNGVYFSHSERSGGREGVDTGKRFKTATGEILPIFKSERGAYYVIRVSKKTQKPYKQYLKL